VRFDLGPGGVVHVVITRDAAGAYWSEFVVRLPEGTLSGGTGAPSASAIDALAATLAQMEGMSRNPTYVGTRAGRILAALCGRGGTR